MSDFIYRWLPRPARQGLVTLALVALCLAAAFFSRPSLPGSVASALAAAHAAPGPETAPEWPRTALRLWFILPRVSLP